MIETAIVPIPERFLSDLYDGVSKSFEQFEAQPPLQCATPESLRRLTCAEQPILWKLGIIPISGQTVQKPSSVSMKSVP